MSAPTSKYRIPFRRLAVHDPAIRQALTAALERVLDHGQVIMGHEVRDFERRFSDAVGVPGCAGVASGTSAVYLALRALNIGAGDEVITSSLSWVATAAAIRATGAIPVFVDIRDDLNLDPDRLTAALSPRTRAIVPVHYCGRICDMPAILKFARQHNLFIVEDAAQAFGAELGGVRAGAFGELGAFSINPMKVLRSLGEAGAITFKNPAYGARITSLRHLALDDAEHCTAAELNHKPSALQAAFINVFLDHYPAVVERRRAMAQLYSARLGRVVVCPPMDEPRRSVFFDYQIIAERRDGLRAFLESQGIEVKIRYHRPLSDHAAFRDSPPADIPRARHLVDHILSLPMEPELPDSDLNIVCDSILSFFRGK